MLKGKTTIELTDVNTGEKKVYEDHNMVTNFAKYLFKNIGGLWNKAAFYDSNSTSYAGSYYPYRTNMLGGIMLFDSDIDPKDGETIFAPTDANMVGCAAYNFTSTNDVRGTYNSSESYYNSQENSMKYVYDFATNQANGTIKSVCLTSIQGGFGGYENPNNVKNDNNSNGNSCMFRQNYYTPNLLIGESFLYAIDIGKEELYYHNITSTTSIDIITRDANFFKKKILSSPYSITTKSTETYTIDINSTSYTAGFYDQKHNTLHVIGHTSYTWNNGVTLKVSKINLTNKTVENYTLTNDTGVTIRLFYDNSTEPKSWSTHAYIYDNILYLCNLESPYGIYKKDTTGASETKQLNINLNKPSSFTCNGRIYFYRSGNSFEQSVYVYNPNSDTVTVSCLNAGLNGSDNWSDNATIVPCIDMNDAVKYSILRVNSGFSYKFITLNNYLATINNLETPITKTNTNTMKVIYTIQET